MSSDKEKTILGFGCGAAGGTVEYFSNVPSGLIRAGFAPVLNYDLIFQSLVVAFLCGIIGVLGKALGDFILKHIKRIIKNVKGNKEGI